MKKDVKILEKNRVKLKKVELDHKTTTQELWASRNRFDAKVRREQKIM